MNVSTTQPIRTKVKGLRWWIVTLIAIATIINYIDRNALAIMWPGISKEVGLDKEHYAFIISCFMVAYGISQSASGKLFDAVGTRLGFVISIVVWSLSAAAHGLARGLGSFAFFRATLGLGEAGNWPGATKSNAEWFPVKERALAQGIFNAGASMGAVISAPLIAVAYALVGWKITFLIIGLLGLLWVIPWWFVNKALPNKHPWITDEEKEYILRGQQLPTVPTVDEPSPSWGQLLSLRQSWSVILSRFFLDPVWWLFVSWLPIYLADRFGFDIKQIGAFAWVPYVGAAIGSLGGGWMVGRWIGRGWSVNRARKTAIVLGGLLMFPSLVASAFASTPEMAMAFIFFALMGFQIAIGNIQTLPSDFLSGKAVGSLAGLGGTAAVLGVLVTTWLVPVLTVESYTPFFVMAALLVPLGVAAVLALSGQIKRI